MRERTVARAVLCKQTGVNFTRLMPVQRAHAESHCLFCAKQEPTRTQVVTDRSEGKKRRSKRQQAVARYAASLSDHLPMLKGGENHVEEPREHHKRAGSYI